MTDPRITIAQHLTAIESDAAVLLRLANQFEAQADAIAITYQDAEQRRMATGPYRARVAMLRGIAAKLTEETR